MFYLCLVYIQTNILFMCYNYKFTLYFSFKSTLLIIAMFMFLYIGRYVLMYYYTM